MFYAAIHNRFYSVSLRTSARGVLVPQSYSHRLSLPRLHRGTRHARNMHLDSYLVTPKQLNSALDKAPNGTIIPLCASWFLPNDPERRTGLQTFHSGRIPNARFFDLDAVKDPNSPYPHMLPSSADFAKAMGKLGISHDDTVVVYDTKELGIFSAPRVAWTLRTFGHQKTHVLNNFRIWVQDGYPTESGEPAKVEPKRYVSVNDVPKTAVDFDYVKDVARGKRTAQILDARPKNRFDGVGTEPRAGLPSGHIPGSVSVPFSELLDPDTKTLLPPDKFKDIFRSKGISDKDLIVSSCGTGVTAAILDTALEEAGYPPEIRLLYDGSWTEWAMRVKPEDKLIESNK